MSQQISSDFDLSAKRGGREEREGGTLSRPLVIGARGVCVVARAEFTGSELAIVLLSSPACPLEALDLLQSIIRWSMLKQKRHLIGRLQ